MNINGRSYNIAPYANLRDANLRDANLSEADLHGVNLRGANLYGASLYGANLYGASLCEANLCGANLREADLHGANLRGASLCEANLYGANLHGANLRGANLRGANLRGANLRDADLSGADLDEVFGLDTFRITPDGAFIAYKKLASGEVATVSVPVEAERVNALGSRKIRVSVLRVEAITGVSNGQSRTGTQYPGLIYEPGTVLSCDSFSFDPDPRVKCSRGLHVFLTKAEAEEWS